jgi:hypothetical protein
LSFDNANLFFDGTFDEAVTYAAIVTPVRAIFDRSFDAGRLISPELGYEVGATGQAQYARAWVQKSEVSQPAYQDHMTDAHGTVWRVLRWMPEEDCWVLVLESRQRGSWRRS